METTKIKGLVINFTPTVMTIEDSYKITNVDKMKIILKEALEKTEDFTSPRSIQSFIDEWLVHNNFYKLHLFRKHTKNTDFTDEESKIVFLGYKIFSFPNKIKYKIMKFKEKRKIKKQTKAYKKYIEEHQSNILKAFEEMKENPIIYQILNQNNLLYKLSERVAHHDESKYSEEEFEPYRKNFFPISQQEKEENKDAFDKAWEHHWRANSHHWQHRQNKKSFDKNDNEEILDVLENVLDWLAMGYKFNDRPYQYYENNKDHIILNDEEKKFLEYIIYEGIDAEYINKESSDGTRE